MVVGVAEAGDGYCLRVGLSDELGPVPDGPRQHAHVYKVEWVGKCPVGFEVVDEELEVRGDAGVVSAIHGWAVSGAGNLQGWLDGAQVDTNNLASVNTIWFAGMGGIGVIRLLLDSRRL